MAHPFRYIVCLLPASLIAVVVGCSSTPAAPPEEAPKVSVQHPQARTLTNVEEFNGWLQPDKTVEVRARVRGHIQKVHFKDGDIVKEGQPLFTLDPRPFESDLASAKEKYEVYKSQKEAMVKEEARLRELEKKGGASKRQVEKAEADVKSLEAQMRASEVDIERAKLDLEYSQIKAEISGKIGQALLTKGNLVNAGGSDPLLTTIVSIDPIRLAFNIDERSLNRYAQLLGAEGKTITETLTNLEKAKATVEFALDGETKLHPGLLVFADNKIDPATGTLPVYALVKNPGGKFLAGARARVRIPIGKAYEAWLIPEAAILADQSKRYVLIVDDKNVVRRRDVTPGKLTSDGMRAIEPVDRPAEGERMQDWWVIVDNLQRARISYPVDPQKTK